MIGINDFGRLRKLGQGSFGNVYLVRFKSKDPMVRTGFFFVFFLIFI